jgi:hypothetical protein
MLMSRDSMLLRLLVVTLSMLEGGCVVMVCSGSVVSCGGQMALVGRMFAGGHGRDPLRWGCGLGGDCAAGAKGTPETLG